jgi:hypothetical protein
MSDDESLSRAQISTSGLLGKKARTMPGLQVFTGGHPSRSIRLK